jgi:hypothetical protein
MSTKRGPGRPRKVGRPKKAPGAPVDNKLTPRMRIAIAAIVEDNLPRKEAAKIAGLSDDAVRKAMRDNLAARAYYTASVRQLIEFTKARAVHTLIKEMSGNNATARVAAARTLLEEAPHAVAAGNMPQAPGFAILIADQRSQAVPIDITPLNNLPALAPRSQLD